MQRWFNQALLVVSMTAIPTSAVLAQTVASEVSVITAPQGLSVDWGARQDEGKTDEPPKTTKTDPLVREPFDPSKPALGEPDLCVVLRGGVRPECAAVQAGQEIVLSSTMFDGPSGDDETTCRRVADRRPGPDGKPVRVWLDVCDGDEGPQTRLRSGAILAEDVIVAPEASNLGDSLEVIVPSKAP
jgi:hypothetical protein